jgi:hypothetical protein
MRFVPAVLILLIVAPVVLRAEPPADKARDAVRRSLDYLAAKGVAWKEQKNCASCHHVPMTVWSLNEARARGFAVDEKVLADLTAWMTDPADPAKVLAKRDPKAGPRTPLITMITALGVGAGTADDQRTRDGLKTMLPIVAGEQTEKGQWNGIEGRLPILASGEVMTALALLALTPPGESGAEKDVKAAAEKGVKWLADVAAQDDLQTDALRLILWQRLGKPKEERDALVKRVLARQNEDGGWGQAKDMASDAYATGQALYALATAGTGPDDGAVNKGQAFLVKTQREDGSWAMASRPMKPGGAGAKELEPITHMGTAWGALGLVRSLPKQPEK